MRWRRLLVVVPVLAGGYLTAAIGLEVHGRRVRASGTFDAIVVAGCHTRPDGVAGPALTRRTRHAVRLWQRGVAPRIVITGGPSHGGHTEAAAGGRYAQALGVPESALVLEGRSTSTEENADFAAKLLPGAKVLVVSDPYHVFRCRRVFGRYFPAVQVEGAPARYRDTLRGALREVTAVSAYALLGRLS